MTESEWQRALQLRDQVISILVSELNRGAGTFELARVRLAVPETPKTQKEKGIDGFVP